MNERIRKLMARRSALVALLRSLSERADKEQRSLNEEEAAEFGKTENEISAIDKEIEREERLQELEKRTAQTAEESKEERTEKPTPESTQAERMKFRHMGEQFRAVAVAALSHNANIDPRLTYIQRANGMNETNPSEGGFLVAPEYSKEIMELAFLDNDVLARCDRDSTKGNGIKVPYLDDFDRTSGGWGGVQAHWVNEGGQANASKAKLGEWQSQLNKMIVLVPVTEELMEDTKFMGSFVRKAASRAIGFKTLDGAIRGNGAGQMLGILNGKDLVIQAKEAGQPAGTIKAENVVNMWARLHPAFKKNAVWLTNGETFPQLATMSIAIGTAGQLLYMPPGGLSEAPYGRILNRPVIEIEQASALGSQGDLVLADLSQYHILDKDGIREDVSMHVYFATDEMAFRFVYRVNGQSKLKSAITPYKGGKTQGAFISLADRS